MKFKNKSGSSREICLINGTGVVVAPGETVELNESEIYAFEMTRISKFFEISKEKIKKIIKTELEKKEVKEEKEEKSQFLNKTGGDS